jgi:hypothetical protein
MSAEAIRDQMRTGSFNSHICCGCPLSPSSIALTMIAGAVFRSDEGILKLQKHQQKHVSRSVRSRWP